MRDLLPTEGLQVHEGLLVKYIGVFLLTCLLWLGFLKTYTIFAKPVPANTIDCRKVSPHIRVHSSVDEKTYTIDVCAVADSAEGEDFRVEIK
jgi:hypothetical protein